LFFFAVRLRFNFVLFALALFTLLFFAFVLFALRLLAMRLPLFIRAFAGYTIRISRPTPIAVLIQHGLAL